jgi:hypothetical protein
MDAHGHNVARPIVADPQMPLRPFLDFGAGYIRRVLDQLPRQGDQAPWLTSMNYTGDVKLLRQLPVEDTQLHLTSADAAVPAKMGS